MIGLMIRSLLIREATKIRDDSLPNAWEFESTVKKFCFHLFVIEETIK
jgi:hypothetical protein